MEVFDGGSWQTFDPTPVGLRPGNAQTGLVGAYADALSDSINYFWDRYILTFGLADQVALALDALGRARDLVASVGGITRRSAARMLTLQSAMTMLVLIGAGFVLWWMIRGRNSLFDELAAHLRARDIDVGASTTMEEALDELRRAQPDAAAALAPLIGMYEEERFSSRRDRARVKLIRRGLANLS